MILTTVDGTLIFVYTLITMEVVCALLIQKSKILVAQRPFDKSHGGKWEFPGGKLRPQESRVSALKRELNEELKIKELPSLSLLGSVSTSQITLHSYIAPLLSPYLPQEHRSIAWTTWEKSRNFDLCEADTQVLQSFKEKILSFMSREIS